MKRLSFIIVLFIAFMANDTTAQITYAEDAAVSALYNQYINQNKATTYTLGYRVQILSTADRRKMEQVKASFTSKFPEFIPVWTYEAPNYKLRVGAFKTKLETERIRHVLRSEYPSVFPVKDNKIRPIEYL